MTVKYDFTNGNNWTLFWDEDLTAEQTNPVLERYYPIPKFTPPTLFQSPIIKVWCKNPDAPSHWRLGGRYFIKMSAGTVISGGIPETVIKVGKFYLNQAEIIMIPPWSPNYSITFDIAYWHRTMSLAMWEYTGPNTNTIDRKLDDLLGYPQS
ncbi:MAG: hypothetical protein QNJ33_12265 [Crocosphaera sp.]|nr:hypothetical protein [Crocosphaera sp.]